MSSPTSDIYSVLYTEKQMADGDSEEHCSLLS